jgi:uncharacterized repeat protein (TIGR03803 family)
MGSMLRRTLAVGTVLLASATAASAQYRFEVVHAFAASGSAPRTPSGPLLETADGSLYGTTPFGGAGNGGAVFQLLPDRNIVTRDLAGATTGRNPYAGLIQTADGTLYGTTKAGGANDSGTLFAITSAGTFITYDLPIVTNGTGKVFASGPTDGLVLAADGNLYAAVPGRTCCSPISVYDGGIVRLTPQGAVTKLSVSSQMMSPHGPLVAGPGGYLYGTARAFGFSSTAFRLLPSSGQSEVIHTFTSAEAPNPTALVLAPDGYLYGAATGGTATEPATVFRMTPSGSVAVLHQFQDAEGTDPVAPLVVGGDGNLYGVTSRGGAFNAGTIFRISLNGDFSVIYSFTGGADGGTPVASLIQSRDGSLYGTASTGGPDGGGVVFRIKAVVPQPLLSIDIPGGGSITAPFEIGGWAIDHGAWSDVGIDAVHVYVYPNPGSGAPPIFLGAAPLGFARPDIAALYGPQFANAGWLMSVGSLPAGRYLLIAFGHSSVSNAFNVSATREFELNSRPLMSIDSPAPGSVVAFGTRVFVGGWALDQGAPAGTGIDAIHVWIYPNGGAGTPFFAGVANYGVSRADVGAVFGARFTNSGYELDVNGLAPGSYLIAVFAHSTVTNSFVLVRTRLVTVAIDSRPLLTIDAPAPGTMVSATSQLFIGGWAIDRGALSGTGIDAVHVWMYPNSGAGSPFFAGVATYGVSRPDVGAAFGSRFTDSGYGLNVGGLAPGTYLIAVSGHSSVTNSFVVLQTRAVIIQ